MKLALNPLLAAVAPPPIAEAHSWIEGRRFPAEKPLIDVAQAVPGYPPPPALTDHLAAIVGEAASARYTDILGLPALRAALARDMGDFYGASLAAEDVGITAGCNQAFCLALLALARAGEEVILRCPIISTTRCGSTCRASPRDICPSGPSAVACRIRPMRRR